MCAILARPLHAPRHGACTQLLQRGGDLCGLQGYHIPPGWWFGLHVPLWRFDPFELGALLRRGRADYARLSGLYLGANALGLLLAGLTEGFSNIVPMYSTAVVVLAGSFAVRQGPYTGAMERWNATLSAWGQQVTAGIPQHHMRSYEN